MLTEIAVSAIRQNHHHITSCPPAIRFLVAASAARLLLRDCPCGNTPSPYFHRVHAAHRWRFNPSAHGSHRFVNLRKFRREYGQIPCFGSLTSSFPSPIIVDIPILLQTSFRVHEAYRRPFSWRRQDRAPNNCRTPLVCFRGFLPQTAQ